jgi:hypothetical protein
LGALFGVSILEDKARAQWVVVCRVSNVRHWTINNWKANSYDESIWFVEAGARENQLSKGLRIVSRSEKNSIKSLFSSKNLQLKHFFHGNTTMIGIQTRFPISSNCFTSLCSKK